MIFHVCSTRRTIRFWKPAELGEECSCRLLRGDVGFGPELAEDEASLSNRFLLAIIKDSFFMAKDLKRKGKKKKVISGAVLESEGTDYVAKDLLSEQLVKGDFARDPGAISESYSKAFDRFQLGFETSFRASTSAQRTDPVVLVRVCCDALIGKLPGYGFVNYDKPQGDAREIEVLNFTPLNGKAIRIVNSLLDPGVRRSEYGNIFIKNLDKAIDQKALHDTFSAFGNILSYKIATDQTGQSKGYGFLQYDSEEGTQKAIEKLNGMLLNDKQVYVGPFLRKQERDLVMDKTKFTNVYVKNLSELTTDEEFNKVFSEYGLVSLSQVQL
ncbi:polyadenylate-binding protein 2-like protein [Tanacetum coccineum]